MQLEAQQLDRSRRSRDVFDDFPGIFLDDGSDGSGTLLPASWQAQRQEKPGY
jgi:hypothetical protein